MSGADADGSEAERELVAAAQRGDRDAFRQLYEANIDRILRYLAARVPHHDAEELAAETFAKAWAKLDQFEWRGIPFSAWLYRIAGNLVISLGRRTTPVVLEHEHLDGPGGDDIELQVEADSDARLVTKCLEDLEERHREVLKLRFLDELSVAEVSSLLGIQHDAVRALTYRALKALRIRYREVAET